MDIDLGDIDLVIKAFESAAKINWTGLYQAIAAKDIDGELQGAADIAGIVAMFVPEAVYVKDALVAVELMNKLREEGLWRPGQPEDPGMAAAEGHTNYSTGNAPVIVPGGTPEDPLNFDGRK